MAEAAAQAQAAAVAFQQAQQAALAADAADRARRAEVDPEAVGVYGAARRAVEADGPGLLPLRDLRDALAKVPIYDEGKSRSDFRHHLVRLRKYAALYGVVSPIQRKLLLVYSIDGPSALRIRHLDVDSDFYANTLDYEQFEAAIVEVFHPVSERNLARAEFMSRTQNPDEDVSSYFSAKSALFRIAVQNNTEAEFPLLLEETVAGLYSVPIKRAVWARAPKTVEELHKAILECVGAERIAFQRGFGQVTSLDGLLSVTSAQESLRNRRQRRAANRNDEVEDMEINELRGRSAERPFSGTCFLCRKRGHPKRLCPERKKTEGRKCFHCQVVGHFANNCPRKKAGKPKVSRVNQLAEEEELDFTGWTEEDIEEFFNLQQEEREAAGINAMRDEKPEDFRRGGW